MQEITLTARVGAMARRVITTAGGCLTPGRSTKQKVTFPATKVWRYSSGTDYLVGWNVLTHYKSKDIIRCRHPRLLTVRQLDEIDKLILPRLEMHEVKKWIRMATQVLVDLEWHGWNGMDWECPLCREPRKGKKHSTDCRIGWLLGSKTKEGSMKKTLCVDFDGVLHSYTTGWKGADVVTDPPVPGAIRWLRDMVGGPFQVCIYSSRSKHPSGVAAMREAIKRWAMEEEGDSKAEAEELVEMLEFPTMKPAAFLTIDDRCICFNGTFPSSTEISSFIPWNKKKPT